MPIRPGLDPKWLGIKIPFSKKYRKFEKKNNGQISITGPDLDRFFDRYLGGILTAIVTVYCPNIGNYQKLTNAIVS